MKMSCRAILLSPQVWVAQKSHLSSKPSQIQVHLREELLNKSCHPPPSQKRDIFRSLSHGVSVLIQQKEYKAMHHSGGVHQDTQRERQTNSIIGMDVVIKPSHILLGCNLQFQPFQEVAEHIIAHWVSIHQRWTSPQLACCLKCQPAKNHLQRWLAIHT
jgi:hypothetical protein